MKSFLIDNLFSIAVICVQIIISCTYFRLKMFFYTLYKNLSDFLFYTFCAINFQEQLPLHFTNCDTMALFSISLKYFQCLFAPHYLEVCRLISKYLGICQLSQGSWFLS